MHLYFVDLFKFVLIKVSLDNIFFLIVGIKHILFIYIHLKSR